ncbi:A-kinase anchor protein 7-like isoform X2 [Girardinichthys multiradiatus]|uniref:A-kinase anchor protein 7-like isoform X2 n=1 Tax=Girardinichthys multiradiatus TaxID=208333 RepID=UPI001FAC6183|nr:A-kinase anchor protein 7-like isoform X2 [Girardinichthys multiradiatus]
MISGRVLLSLSLHRSKSVCSQILNVVKELQVWKLHSTFTNICNKVETFKPPAHQFRPQAKRQPCVCLPAVDVMQTASICYGGEANAVASNGEGDDEEGCTGGAETLVEVESRMQQVKMITAGQVDATCMEVHGSPADAETSRGLTSTKSNEKKSKRRMRKERQKLMKKKLISDEASASLMSELPFALTSPTTWKELGFPTLEMSEKKRKRKRGDSGGRIDSEEDGDQMKKKKKSPRPNYFVSIPITNTAIKSLVKEVQEAVLQQEPRLAKAMVPVPTLHITLLVTYLASQEQVDMAAAVLAQVEPSVAKLLGGRDLVLPFSGIRHFRKEVVFVGLDSGEHRHTLDSLAELLQRRFEEQGLLQGDCRHFEPHLTIMKLSRASKLRFQGIKRVEPGLYSDYTNKFFGNQTVERLDLCSMLKKKQQDGYYHTETSLQLGGRRQSEPDEAELLRVSRRLVEDAVSRALQQYKQETLQNGGGPNAAAVQPIGNKEGTKTDTTANSSTDNRK